MGWSNSSETCIQQKAALLFGMDGFDDCGKPLIMRF
jgi:hypothetical protein